MLIFIIFILTSIQLAHPFVLFMASTTATPSLVPELQEAASSSIVLDGDWRSAVSSLQGSNCCVVSIPGIDSHLRTLQEHLADKGPADVDLRARIRISSPSSSTTYNDCLKVRQSVIPYDDHSYECTSDTINDNDANNNKKYDDPCTVALEELARGMSSFAYDGPLEGVDVFVRIVCASNYRARDPPFHTDKAPLRGYVTLRGVGTEFMTRPCSPLDYVTLRTIGKGEPTESLVMAQELQFIVMKGDYYYTKLSNDKDSDSDGGASFIDRIWARARACVHRSPPGYGCGGRRVIVSFDLADGDDDREWYQNGKKREWRNGLTQRKSHLVA